MSDDPTRGLLRRVSYIVEDADKAADFYQELFGWTRFYDNDTPVDYRFPPCAPDGTVAHINILQVDDPFIGMLAFLSYKDFKPEQVTDPAPKKLGVGSSVLVVHVGDIHASYEKAKAMGARLVSEPVDWTVTDYSGEGVIKLSTYSFFDPNGIYVEVNTRR